MRSFVMSREAGGPVTAGTLGTRAELSTLQCGGSKETAGGSAHLPLHSLLHGDVPSIFFKVCTSRPTKVSLSQIR